MTQGAVKRSGRGRPRLRPHRVIADKGYSARRIRQYCRRHGIRYTIPRRRDERHRGRFDSEMYRQRNVVERAFCRLKHFRRLATRYEKLGVNFRAMWIVAFIFLWSQFANAP